MKTNILKLIGVQTLLVFAALLFGGSSASAAPDTCVWTGGGSGVEDTGEQTWTFNVNDASNWSTCDNGTIPEDGDILEFPANLADVDPDDSEDDDYNWKYIVNNDLTAGTSFAGIVFTGDPGTDYTEYDDDYVFGGNDFTINGDIDNQYTERSNGYLTINAGVTLAANIMINDVDLGGFDLTDASLVLAGYDLELCDSANANRLESSYSVRLDLQSLILDGESDINVNCSFNNILASTSGNDSNTRNINVASKSQLSLYSGAIVSETSNFSSINLADKAILRLVNINQDFELTENVTFAGGIYTNEEYETDRAYSSGGGGGSPGAGLDYDYLDGPNSENATRLSVSGYGDDAALDFSGNVTLAGSTLLAANIPVEFSGTLTGDGELVLREGSNSLNVSGDNSTDTPDGQTQAELLVVEISGDDDSQSVFAQPFYNTVLKQATVGDVTVQENARFSGEGTVGALDVETGATIAPGESPGCIETDGDLTLNGTYDFEIDTNTACSGYDQLDVSGAVDISGATLELSLLDGYNFEVDDEFILINNDGSDDVTGEFTGLEEGDSITVDGNSFTISYEGGDGNDVSVLATSISENNASSEDAPGAPDTGVGSLIQNPMITMIAAALAAGAMIGLRKVNSTRK